MLWNSHNKNKAPAISQECKGKYTFKFGKLTPFHEVFYDEWLLVFYSPGEVVEDVIRINKPPKEKIVRIELKACPESSI